MQCNHCGATIDEGASFCDQCGRPLKETATEKTSSVQKPSRASPLGLATQPEVQPVQAQPKPEPVPPEPGVLPLPRVRAKKGAPLALISHWGKLIQGLQMSPMDFYSRVQRAIETRALPDTSMAQVEWPEGGVFSAKRVYLRVTRKDHVFDICGAPFGNGFFVSWWLGETPTGSIFYLLALLFAILVLLGVATYVTFNLTLGFFLALVLVVIGLPAIFLLLGPQAVEAVDYYLMMLPWVSPVYERFFRPVTYYKIDTALMFQAAVDGAVQEVVDDIMKAKGLRALSELERKPIMRDFLGR